MFCKILIMAGIYIDLNHHLNFTDDQQMTAFLLMGIGICFDLIWNKLK